MWYRTYTFPTCTQFDFSSVCCMCRDCWTYDVFRRRLRAPPTTRVLTQTQAVIITGLLTGGWDSVRAHSSIQMPLRVKVMSPQLWNLKPWSPPLCAHKERSTCGTYKCHIQTSYFSTKFLYSDLKYAYLAPYSMDELGISHDSNNQNIINKNLLTIANTILTNSNIK